MVKSWPMAVFRSARCRLLRVNVERLLASAHPRMNFAVIRRSSVVALLVVLCLPALWPMLSVTFWTSHDGLHHIFRLANFDDGLRSGVLYPRWADALGFGYGFPVTNYYAPLAYYVAAFIHLFGAGILDSLKLTYALGFVVSALGMYRLARDFVGSRAALLAAVAYTYYPYHIADTYMRGTVTEFCALTFLPLIVWLVRRSLQAHTRRMQWIYALFSAVSLCALMLTHNLSAFLFLPALGFYVLLVSVRRGWRECARALAWFAAEVALALALAAFYLLPALGEVAWIRAGQVSGSVDDIQTMLTPITQFVSLNFMQPYVPDAPASLQHPLGLAVALLSAVACMIGFARRKQLSSARRGEWIAWATITVVTMIAMLNWSAPLWANVRVLAFVQYPYRLHAILGLALAMLIALGAQAVDEWYPSRITHRAARVVSGVIGLAIAEMLIVSSLGALDVAPQALPGHKEPISEAQINLVGMSEYDYQTALWARLYGGPWLLEYMPAWVTEAREEFFLPMQSGSANLAPLSAPRVALEDYRPQQRTLRVESAEPFQLSFHTFYFPSWQARVDGVAVPTFPTGPLALASVDVPAGQHMLTLAFESTQWQRAGEWLSLLTVVMIVATVTWRGRHRKLWLSLILLLLATLLSLRSLEVGVADGPQAVTATFDNQFDLVGYQIDRAVYQPGDVADLTLYWFARQTPHEDFKVFVHMDGANGRAGQTDAQPGLNFSPTTRWQRGEIIADHYRLKIAANAARGTYEILAGIYRPQPLQNLGVVSANATPDNRVRLGTIEIR
jgi:6-pyruvoyl-tetrahydropterin synthase-like protein